MDDCKACRGAVSRQGAIIWLCDVVVGSRSSGFVPFGVGLCGLGLTTGFYASSARARVLPHSIETYRFP